MPRSGDHPHAMARSTKAYCRAVDSTFSTTCCGWDWRTYTIAWRRRGWARSFPPIPPAPLGLREGSVMRHLLLRQQAVPSDDARSEEHTSELQSLTISYAVF